MTKCAHEEIATQEEISSKKWDATCECGFGMIGRPGNGEMHWICGNPDCMKTKTENNEEG